METIQCDVWAVFLAFPKIFETKLISRACDRILPLRDLGFWLEICHLLMGRMIGIGKAVCRSFSCASFVFCFLVWFSFAGVLPLSGRLAHFTLTCRRRHR